MYGVFRNTDPRPPHRPASVYPPAFGAGGGHTRWAVRGSGVNSSEDVRHYSVLYICKYILCAVSQHRKSTSSCYIIPLKICIFRVKLQMLPILNCNTMQNINIQNIFDEKRSSGSCVEKTRGEFALYLEYKYVYRVPLVKIIPLEKLKYRVFFLPGSSRVVCNSVLST